MIITITLGEQVARNIAAELNRLDWDYDRLARECNLTWGDLVAWRGDAGSMGLDALAAVAAGLGVSPAQLIGVSQ